MDGDYRERAARVPGVTVWTRRDGGGVYRVLPDGCMDLIWYEGTLLVAGPDTVAHLAEDRPGTDYAGLRFAPGAGPALLGAPAREVRDLRVPLDALWPGADARRLAERVAAGPAAGLEGWAVDRVRATGAADPLPGAVAGALARGRPVAEVAAGTGLGERQLRRRCEAAFGYGPKTLARVLRLQRALALARRGTSFAEVAVAAGYADQPHLAREVRALTGVPLGRLLGP
ncbi:MULTISPECIES: helix-turn-helix transcriptional regulator [unclassified Streptomyces]|uniref:helix-turn-helix transcriptional regulator n=1 Tax=unclassified Streptomyces TaxID=2593676 RepID=UPI002E2A0778|nr:helix-turn-helix transcriptional regulator [Streptomyces sp. NBC_00223]